MGADVRARPKARSRTVAVAVGASLLFVLFAAGLVFANSVGAGQVAANASSLHWVNATLGTSSLTRAALAQSVTYSGLEQRGLAEAETLAFTSDQLTAAHEGLRSLQADGSGSDSALLLADYLATIEQAMAQLAARNTSAANRLLLGDVEAAYIDLVASLQVEQSAIQQTIEDNTETAGAVNGVVVFVLTLLVPAVAVAVYWSVARRQVKEHQRITELELEAERDVSKAKDSFIAGLSHELRTPLTSIYGFAEILTDGGASDPDQVVEMSQIVANEASEMMRMVDDLLMASRMESLGVEIEATVTRVQDIVESAITPFERAGLTVTREPTEAVVETDGARLRHVLVNLISNAAQHGGESVGLGVSEAGGTVDIEVWDDGAGVAEENLEKLFERFVHTGAQPLLTGSVGLGLAVASRLSTMLGGRLSYQRYAQKTYFVVSIPSMTVEEVDERNRSRSVSGMIRAMSS